MASEYYLWTTTDHYTKESRMYLGRIDRITSTLPGFLADYPAAFSADLKTKYNYLLSIRSFFKFLYPEKKEFSRIKKEDFLLLSDKAGIFLEGLSPSKKKLSLAALRTLFSFLETEAELDPTKDISYVYKKKDEPDTLSDEEIAKLFYSVEDETKEAKKRALYFLENSIREHAICPAHMLVHLYFRDLLIMKMFLYTGIDTDSLAALDTYDVDCESCTLTLRRGDERNEFKITKGIASMLQDYILLHRPEIGSNAVNEKALFLSYTHGRISVRSIQDMLKRHGDVAFGGRRSLTVTVLRNTYEKNAQPQDK